MKSKNKLNMRYTRNRVNRAITALTTAIELETSASLSERFKGDMTPVTHAIELIDGLRTLLADREVAQLSHIQERRNRGLFTIIEAAKYCGVPPSTLTHHIHAKNVLAPHTINPTCRLGSVGNRRNFYLKKELSILKRFFKSLPKNPHLQLHLERRKNGFYSSTDVARMCGITQMPFTVHVKRKRIPKPTHEVQGCVGFYYNKKEAESIRQILKEKKWRDK
jgi:hypothetical protein